MRTFLALVLLAAPGCSKEAPRGTDRSVWWAPLASWNGGGLIQPVPSLLQGKGIDVRFVGGRGERIWVPWERHAEAAGLLRASPHAATLKVHAVLAGPRPDAFLPKRTSADEGAVWTSLVVFTPADVPIETLQRALQAENIESGVVAFAGTRGEAHLFVPPASAAAARSLLKGAAWAGRLLVNP